MIKFLRDAKARFACLLASRRGTTATIFAFAAPIVLGSMALAVDTVNWYTTKTRLQRAADTGALGAARELTLANRDPEAISNVARRFALSHLGRGMDAGALVNSELVDGGAGVRVDVTRDVQPILGRLLGDIGVTIRATATARVTGAANVCAIGLAATGDNIVRFRNTARLTAQACAVYSNSINPAGLVLNDGSNVTSALLCSSGGANVAPTAIAYPRPTVDCPSIGDPLAGRSEPAIGACNYNNMQVTTGTVTLSPGVYCGGLTITNSATATLLPGVYIIKDGDLVATKSSTISGTNVSFFFKATSVAATAGLRFDKLATINLTAPSDGPLAGLLFFEAPGNPARNFRITSDNARVLLGTIYLPVSRLTIDSTRPVSDLSAYTVIVANQIWLESGPNLYLNANYGLTDVPVPKGVGPVGRIVKLGASAELWRRRTSPIVPRQPARPTDTPR